MQPKLNVTILLDRSGSMEGPTKKDHIGGMRSFIKDQQGQPGKTKFNFIQFDTGNPFELIYDNVNIDEVNVENINLVPRGGTPLLDAVGKTIAHIEEQELKDKSDQVILMIITDGEENMSREWKREDIKHIIDTKKDDWKILFLGANIDNFNDARSMGVTQDCTIGYDNNHDSIVKGMYCHGTSAKVTAARNLFLDGADKEKVHAVMSYNASDRQWGDNSQNLADTIGE